MFASPVITGRIYQVRGHGFNFVIPAGNGADAISTAVDMLIRMWGK